MATTTNYGWTTPDDTSLVKDGAAAIRTLGSSVDTTTKALNPSTTLGDIEYRSSTANTNTRLAIGSSGQVLTVSGGVPAWSTPAGPPAFAGCRIRPTANQSIANLTSTAVVFDSEDYDTDGYHSNTVNNTRMTIPTGKAGYYQMNATVQYDANGTGIRDLWISKNGSAAALYTSRSGQATNLLSMNITSIFYGAVGDYFQIYVFQNSGVALNLLNPTTATAFDIGYLGA
jgi:hypothetical protein